MTSCTNTGRKGRIRLEVCGREMGRNYLDKQNNKKSNTNNNNTGSCGTGNEQGVGWRVEEGIGVRGGEGVRTMTEHYLVLR